jgi:hypothetical protein
VDSHTDLTAAHQASGQTKAAFGQSHFNNHGVKGSHKMPKGCSALYVPPVDESTWAGSSYTDAQFEAYVNAYPDLLARYNAGNRSESIAQWGRKHYAYFGSSEGRSSGLVTALAAVASSGSGGGGGASWSASGTLVDTKTGNSGTDFDAWGSPNGMMTENFAIQYQPAVDTKITSVSFWMKNWTGGNGCVSDSVAQPFIAHIIAFDTGSNSTSGSILASSNEATSANSASYIEVSASFTTTPVLTSGDTYLILYTSNGTTGTQSNLCYSWERTDLSDSEVIGNGWRGETTVTGGYLVRNYSFSTKIVGSQYQ